MIKLIKKTLIGLILILIIVPSVGYYLFCYERNNLKSDLQEVIDNRFLEGKAEIGAYFLDLDSIALNRVKDFDSSDKLSWIGVRSAGIWNSLTFDNLETINVLMSSGEYEWYNFDLEGFSPFMIIVKKTVRGYDIIGEYILGIGIKYNFPKYLIHKTSSKMDFGKLGGVQKFYNFSTTPSLAFEYVNHLTKNKYSGLFIRNEVTQDKNGFKVNSKLELLNKLVMKSVAPVDESLCFRTNKYFELKYDDSYTYMGSQPIQWISGSFGNDTKQLFNRTVTLHYSIQENEGVLKNEYIKRFLGIFAGSIVLYLLFIFILYKKSLLTDKTLR